MSFSLRIADTWEKVCKDYGQVKDYLEREYLPY